MIHTATDERIKAAFEIEGRSPEEISQDEGFSVMSVKAKLMQVSTTYRKLCKVEPEEEDRLNFSNEELIEMNQIMLETARCAELPDGQPDWK